MLASSFLLRYCRASLRSWLCICLALSTSYFRHNLFAEWWNGGFVMWKGCIPIEVSHYYNNNNYYYKYITKLKWLANEYEHNTNEETRELREPPRMGGEDTFNGKEDCKERDRSRGSFRQAWDWRKGKRAQRVIDKDIKDINKQFFIKKHISNINKQSIIYEHINDKSNKEVILNSNIKRDYKEIVIKNINKKNIVVKDINTEVIINDVSNEVLGRGIVSISLLRYQHKKSWKMPSLAMSSTPETLP